MSVRCWVAHEPQLCFSLCSVFTLLSFLSRQQDLVRVISSDGRLPCVFWIWLRNTVRWLIFVVNGSYYFYCNIAAWFLEKMVNLYAELCLIQFSALPSGLWCFWFSGREDSTLACGKNFMLQQHPKNHPAQCWVTVKKIAVWWLCWNPNYCGA